MEGSLLHFLQICPVKNKDILEKSLGFPDCTQSDKSKLSSKRDSASELLSEREPLETDNCYSSLYIAPHIKH